MKRWADLNTPKHSNQLYGQPLGKSSKKCPHEQTNSDCQERKAWKPEWQGAGHSTGRTGPVQLAGGKPCRRRATLTTMALSLSNHETSIHQTISGLFIWASQCSIGQKTIEPRCQGTDLSKSRLHGAWESHESRCNVQTLQLTEQQNVVSQ